MCKGPEAGQCLYTQRTRKQGRGLNRVHKERAVADKVIETMDQILQSPEYL